MIILFKKFKYFRYLLLAISCFAISCRTNHIESLETDFIVFSTESLILDWEGGERTISVYSDYDWFILPTYADWIEIRQDSDFQITVISDSNLTKTNRTLDIPVLCNNKQYRITVRQDARQYVVVKSEKCIGVGSDGGCLNCEVESNTLFEVQVNTEDNKWLVTESTGNELIGLKGNLNTQNERTVVINVLPNNGTEPRQGVIYFKAMTSELKDSVLIIQSPYSYSQDGNIADGEVRCLQTSEYDKLNLVVMGDGFLESHLYSGGVYEYNMEQAVDAFFSIPPYSQNRDLFNVYLVGVESQTDVIGNNSEFGTTSRTRLGTAFGSGTEIVCNDDVVFEYACKAVPVSESKPALIIVVLNSDKYAGTCYMYQDGNAIALCPMSKAEPPYDFDSVVRHEAGGHGFGFLADEYVYYQQQIPANNVKEIKKWQEYGFMMNLDFTSDHSAILWKDFVNLSDYPEVGIYEGGDQYQYGVWRSEENSCMNNNIPYYNIQSRWTIYKRIHQMAGLPYSVSDFLSIDDRMSVIQTGIFQSDSCQMDFVPLASPKLIRSSCIEK